MDLKLLALYLSDVDQRSQYNNADSKDWALECKGKADTNHTKNNSGYFSLCHGLSKFWSWS